VSKILQELSRSFVVRTLHLLVASGLSNYYIKQIRLSIISFKSRKKNCQKFKNISTFRVALIL